MYQVNVAITSVMAAAAIMTISITGIIHNISSTATLINVETITFTLIIRVIDALEVLS